MLGITIDFDAKHLSKRLRTPIIDGKMSILEKKIDAQVVKSILHPQGVSDREIQPVLNPADKQNVPLAVKLLELLAKEVDTKNLSPGLKDVLPAFKLLREICIGLLSLFARPSMNINEILGRASTLSHILMILKNHRDIELPNVLYHDLQSTVQNLYFMTPKFKVYFPGKDFSVYQNG